MQRGLGGSPHERLHQDRYESYEAYTVYFLALMSPPQATSKSVKTPLPWDCIPSNAMIFLPFALA
ncbi:MAG: hypothetical protein F6K55_40745 [Moorea sp. SIO4A3]|nr:hypothetical protein [Moorena sp. SIO4A3]